ncbi:MAG: type II toxin-antitoxin system VapC family toxin [Acetobacteraceae bacterium]|nr:type II toxin-antitoxin system VapC family toxin [Acetobacteraceae bacterium]
MLDASVTLAWALAGEVRAEDARALVHRVAEEAAIVPALWRLEVGNGLLMAARRGRVRAERVDAVWRLLNELPIEIDAETNARAWSGTATLARRHGLTLYDAAYLELAARRSLPLATFDTPLARAAVAEKVPLAAEGAAP